MSILALVVMVLIAAVSVGFAPELSNDISRLRRVLAFRPAPRAAAALSSKASAAPAGPRFPPDPAGAASKPTYTMVEEGVIIAHGESVTFQGSPRAPRHAAVLPRRPTPRRPPWTGTIPAVKP